MRVSMAGNGSQTAVVFVLWEHAYLLMGDRLCDLVLGVPGGRALPRACSVSSFGVGRRALSVFRCAWAYPDHAALDARGARDGGRLRYPHSSSAQQVLSPMQAAASDREDRRSRRWEMSSVSSTRMVNGSKRQESG